MSQKEYREINFDLVVVNRDQPRRRFDEQKINDLAQSIRTDTLVQAPTIKPHATKSGYYELVTGERRFRALKKLGRTKGYFKLIIGHTDTFRMSLVENLHRENLTPIELAESLKKLRHEYGMTFKEIQDLTGIAPASATAFLKLLDLPEKIQDMVHEGTLPQVSALHLRQFKGPYGKLIRLAHDLVAGKEVARLTVVSQPRNEIDRGRKIREARLPTTPEGLLLRILAFAYRVPSLVLSIQAFQEFSERDRKHAIGTLPLMTQKSLPNYFRDLSKYIDDLLPLIE